MPKNKDVAREKKDARGQFARSEQGAENDGVLSANPRVVSGKSDGDATFSTAKEKEK